MEEEKRKRRKRVVAVSSPVKEIKEKSLPSKDEHFHSSSFFLFFETDLCHEKQHKRERAPTNYDRSLNFYKLLSFFSFRKKVVGSIMMTSPKEKEKNTQNLFSCMWKTCHIILWLRFKYHEHDGRDIWLGGKRGGEPGNNVSCRRGKGRRNPPHKHTHTSRFVRRAGEGPQGPE